MKTETCDGCEKTAPIPLIDQMAVHASVLPEGWGFVRGNAFCPACLKRVDEFINSFCWTGKIAA